MSGTKQLEQTIVGKSPGQDDAVATKFFNEKIVLPVVQSMRNTMNQLTGDVFTVTESSVVAVKYGLILADASDGAIVLQLRPPAESHRGYEIVKVDGTLNSVTVEAIDGSLISGAASVVLGSQWAAVSLASDADKYVKVSGSVDLSPDVTGPSDNNTVVAFQRRAFAATAPAKYEVIGSQDGATWQPRKEGMPSFPDVTTTFSLSAASVDSVAATIPASPTGGGRFVIMRVYVRLSTVLGVADTGTVAVRVGTTVGGNDIATDQTVNNASTVGLISGLSRASRGTALLVANNYEASVAAGSTINVRATTTGTITAGACTTYVFGAWVP